jgi:hypothetical protein
VISRTEAELPYSTSTKRISTYEPSYPMNESQ